MPRVAAVTIQPNASVAVPAGAVRSTATECAVTCGVISAPASSIATVSTTSEPSGPVSAIPATHAANAASRNGSRRCIGSGQGRVE
jgi:hypothetical protein